MAVTGGSIIELTIAGTKFSLASDATVNMDLGGLSTEHKPNGDATARDIKTRRLWKLGGVQISLDDSLGQQELLQSIQNGPNVTITIRLASDATYQGEGNIQGEIAFDTMNATATVDLSGPGSLTQQ